jgi:hypothetical protein
METGKEKEKGVPACSPSFSTCSCIVAAAASALEIRSGGGVEAGQQTLKYLKDGCGERLSGG